MEGLVLLLGNRRLYRNFVVVLPSSQSKFHAQFHQQPVLPSAHVIVSGHHLFNSSKNALLLCSICECVCQQYCLRLGLMDGLNRCRRCFCQECNSATSRQSAISVIGKFTECLHAQRTERRMSSGSTSWIGLGSHIFAQSTPALQESPTFHQRT